MVRIRIAACVLSISSLWSVVQAADLVLADAGKSDFRIVIAADAGPSTQYAAKELQSFLKQISAAELPIVTDRDPQAGARPPAMKSCSAQAAI